MLLHCLTVLTRAFRKTPEETKRCGWRQGFSRSQESFLRKLTPLFQLRKKAMWQAGGLPLEKCGMVTVASHTYSAWWRGEERALSSPQVFFFLLLKASFCLRRPRPTFRKRKPDPLLSSDCLSPSPFVTFPQFIPAKKRSEGGPGGRSNFVSSLLRKRKRTNKGCQKQTRDCTPAVFYGRDVWLVGQGRPENRLQICF